MELWTGEALDLGRIRSPEGAVWASLRPLGEGWVLWVRREGSRKRQHLGLLSPAVTGFVFRTRAGRTFESADWRPLVSRVIARFR